MEKQIIINQCSDSIIEKDSIVQIEKIINKFYLEIENPCKFCSVREIIPIIYVIAETYEFIVDKTKWDKIIYEYLQFVRNQIIEEGYQDRLSLFDGMSELGLAIRLLNKKTGYYERFSNEINMYILEKLKVLIRNIIHNNRELRNQDFDCISGVSGIVSYLLHLDKEIDGYDQVVYDAVSYLISIAGYKNIENNRIPRWYIKTSSMNNENDKRQFTSGYFDYSLSHGIAGVLAALSFAYIKNIQLPGQKQAIIKILEEYKKAIIVKNNIPYWPGKKSFESYLLNEKNTRNISKRMSWCYGSIGILSSFKLAERVISNHDFQDWIHESINYIAQIEVADYELDSIMLCHGYSGLLAILATELRERTSKVIEKRVKELTKIIFEAFDPYSPELFKILDYEIFDGQYKLVETHNNSILEGTSGIILTLVSLIKKTDWEMHLLIK